MADMNDLIRQGARRRYVAAEEGASEAQRARDEQGRFTSADGGARSVSEPESGSDWIRRVLGSNPVRDGRFWTG